MRSPTPELKKEFHESNMRVLEELDQFVSFLEEDLLPRSHGQFAVGEAGIQAILDCEEMIDTPVKDILARCYRDLEATETALAALAQEIAPGKTLEEARKQMQDNHPTREELLPTMKRELARMRGYLTERNLMTIPPEMPDVIVSPMPTYRSAGGMMLTPGPFETRAKEAYMAINLPQPDWSEERVQTQLRDFNLYNFTLLFLHEAYPGHHVQFFLEKRVPMRASKDHDSDSNSDGWADYGKYMMVDEIYGPTDPTTGWRRCSGSAARSSPRSLDWSCTCRCARSTRPPNGWPPSRAARATGRTACWTGRSTTRRT